MGEKKRKEAETARWKKVVVVAGCILFVFLMVISGLGFGWLSMFSSVKPGETAVIHFTIYNADGNPVVTTEEKVYADAVTAGQNVLAARQIAIVANQSHTKSVYPVAGYTNTNGWDNEFALFATEYDAVSAALVGMKANEQKSVTLPSSSSMSQRWEKEILEKNNIDINTLSVGDTFALGVSDDPEEAASNSSSKSYLRMAEIVRITPTGIVVEFGYPRMDIRVVQFGTSG
jgi:FKBP-type peptidyl-prolyl cis-trans isomerase 2